MPTQPQPKQWVVDLTAILESISKGAGAILGSKTPTGNGANPDDQVGPAPNPNEPFTPNCPDGYKVKNGVCQKKTSPVLFIGLGLAVAAGTYFLVKKLKNK
jgi:hypothetical protein